VRSVSIVFPAFNEAENIGRSIDRAVAVMEDLGRDFEVIVVDDGSSDPTRSIADTRAAADPRVRCVHHPRNRGYGAALKSGIVAARCELIFFTDADLQFDLGEIGKLLGQAERYDIVAGYRARRSDPVGRRLNAWAWGRLVDLLFDLRVRDIDCAFKVFHRRVLEAIPIASVGACVNTEILVRARQAGFRIHQVAVEHRRRRAGRQTGARPRVILRALYELVSLYAGLRGSGLPPRAPVRESAG
jgi:glycosyltransferase involved in cell wall biosynthesis